MPSEIASHKGRWCVIVPEIFCQEGYCSECQICKDNSERTNQEPEDRSKFWYYQLK